jgi:hypothetical protein
MRHPLFLAAAAAALLAAQPAAAATNLVRNGDFNKNGSFSGDYATYSYFTAPLGFEWDITGTVDVFRTDSFYGGEPDPTGGDPFALDLVGTGTSGGIAQSILTEVGKTYRLTFDYSNNPFISGASMRVGIGGSGGLALEQFVAHNGATTGAMNWQTYTVEFVAKATNSYLFFDNITGGQHAGMYLDNIALYDAADPVGGVPEPATWALMIGGFGLAGAALRRRRSFVLAA